MTQTELSPQDVVIIGAGPAGLSLANLLGMRGVSVTLLEMLPQLIDYPRGKSAMIYYGAARAEADIWIVERK